MAKVKAEAAGLQLLSIQVLLKPTNTERQNETIAARATRLFNNLQEFIVADTMGLDLFDGTVQDFCDTYDLDCPEDDDGTTGE